MSEAILVRTICYMTPSDGLIYVEAGESIQVDLVEQYAVWGAHLFSVEPGEYQLFN